MNGCVLILTSLNVVAFVSSVCHTGLRLTVDSVTLANLCHSVTPSFIHPFVLVFIQQSIAITAYSYLLSRAEETASGGVSVQRIPVTPFHSS